MKPTGAPATHSDGRRLGPTALAGLTGRVVRPRDDEYESARVSWNGLFSHRPAAIVYVQDAQDAVAAVAASRRAGMPLRIRSGGHCLEGWSTLDDGLVIDVSELTSVVIDAVNRTATVGAGLTQQQAVTELGRAGFAVPTGTEGSVGLVGATLGGGFGLLTRAFGMACDNLLAAEIVVAPAAGGADLITVDADHHADLLHALRGAGNGSFGVVTSLTYRLHELAHVSSLRATWTGLDNLPEVFDVWQRTAPVADERLTSQLEVSRDAVVLFALLASGDSAEAERMLEPLLSVGRPQVVVTNADWPDTYRDIQIPIGDEPANWKFNSQFVTDPFPAEALGIIRSFIESAPDDGCNYFTDALGGAVRHGEPPGGSAFAHRKAMFYAEPGAGWGTRGSGAPPEDALASACLDWVAAFAAALQPFVNGAYPNVPNADAPNWQTDYWGRHIDALRATKAAFDPTNVFHFPQSVLLI